MATVICPNCGGENDVTKRGGQECAYCGTMLHLPNKPSNPTRKSGIKKELSDAQFIIPIATKYAHRDEVVKALEAYLVKCDDVPEDINFDNIEVKTIKWLYLPMWRFNGDLSTEWSCDQVIYKKRKVGERPIFDSRGNFERTEVEYETYEDYLPKSGHSHSAFDILVPAIKQIKEKLPYYSLDFNEVDESCSLSLKEGTTLSPRSASMRKFTLKADSEPVLTEVASNLRSKAEKCSFGGLFPRSSRMPNSIIEGRQCINEHCNFTYKLSEDETVGQLYYIPFVYVEYTYMGASYNWGFEISPKRVGCYDYPKEINNKIVNAEECQEEELKKFRTKWNIFLFLSGVFSVMVGMLVFLVRNYSLYERVEKRLKNQLYMGSLRSKYKRRDSLIKRGIDSNTIADINTEMGEEYGYDDYDSDDDKTPKSIIEIDTFFAETEVLKCKLLKRMKLFWVWYISLIVITAIGILGFNYWDKIQEEKMWAEEQAEEEARQQRIQDEVTTIFNTNMIGNSYEGYDLSSFHSHHIKIKILDNKKLQYQIGLDGDEMDFSTYKYKTNWGKPKVVSYLLDVRSKNECYLEFDGYKTSNLLTEYGDGEFIKEFTVPVEKDKTESYHEMYHLKKK